MRRKRLKALAVTFVALNLSLIYTAIIYVVSKARNLEADERLLLAELGCERFVLNLTPMPRLAILTVSQVQFLRSPVQCERPSTDE